MYKIQNAKPKLTAYASKRLPEAARSYSITGLELSGLAINIASFSHLLKREDFDEIVDHLALKGIIKSKAEPATTRIKRLLELISSYSFNLYYMKGKDMILSDFLSRQKNENRNPHEIPISFIMHNILHEKYYNTGKSEKYLVQTWSKTRSVGIKLPEVHGISKNLDPNIKPEKQNIRPLKENEILQEKPKIGQGRPGMRGGRPPPPIYQTNASEVKKKIPEVSKIENKFITHPDFTTLVQSVSSPTTEAINRKPMIKNIPFYPDPTYRTPPKPIRHPSQKVKKI